MFISTTTQVKTSHMWQIYRSHGFVVCVCCRFSVCLSYYALSMNSSELGRSVYASFSLSGLIELPAIFFGYKMLSW